MKFLHGKKLTIFLIFLTLFLFNFLEFLFLPTFIALFEDVGAALPFLLRIIMTLHPYGLSLLSVILSVFIYYRRKLLPEKMRTAADIISFLAVASVFLFVLFLLFWPFGGLIEIVD